MKWASILSVLVAAPALAQTPSFYGAPYREFIFEKEVSYSITTAPHTKQTIQFESGERVKSALLSDPSAYTVTVIGSGDSLALQATRATSLAMLSVSTDQRNYEIELVASLTDPAPRVVRFAYGRSVPRDPVSIPHAQSSARYKLSGDKVLLPESITDDGAKTYLAWREDQAMPAVFAIGSTGEEEMINGYMREGFLTFDRVYEELVFKIDKRKGKARRMTKRWRGKS